MTANETLADHFLRAALVLCCAAGKAVAITAAAAARTASPDGLEAGLAAVRAAAEDACVGLTPHRAVIQRALAAVESINDRITALQRVGGMKHVNAEFKAARQAGTVTRYRDFLHSKKIAMLEALSIQRCPLTAKEHSTVRALPFHKSEGGTAVQEIKPDQVWEDGLHRVRIVNAFGVRIVIQPVGGGADVEIAEDDFRGQYTFVANA
jgi:hypothetical protein